MKQIGWLALLLLRISTNFLWEQYVPTTSDLESHYPPDFEVNSIYPYQSSSTFVALNFSTPTRMNLYVRLLDRMAARGLHQLPVVERDNRERV